MVNTYMDKYHFRILVPTQQGKRKLPLVNCDFHRWSQIQMTNNIIYHYLGWMWPVENLHIHYDDVTMSAMASQITSLAIVYSAVYSDPDQRIHQSSASLAFVQGIHRDRWIPRTMVSNAENVSIWWCHHVVSFAYVRITWFELTYRYNFIQNKLRWFDFQSRSGQDMAIWN